MIDLLLLGTGGMMPMPNRWLSALLVRCRGEITLFDCGEGTQIPWRTTGWGFRSISAICLSHWHADHVAGLPGLLHTIANAGRTEPLAIFGPIHTTTVVAGLRVIAPQLPYEVIVRDLRPGERFALPGGMTGHVIAGDHRVPSLIYRVDVARGRGFDRAAAEASGAPITTWSLLQNGESVVVGDRVVTPGDVLGPERPGLAFGFMTDTRPVPAAATFLRDVDLLISEGTYGDTALLDKAISHKHMIFAEAATIARDAGANALWLTHFSHAMEHPEEFLPYAAEIFPNTTIGVSGLSTTLSFED